MGGTGGNLIDSGSGEFTRCPNFQRLITGGHVITSRRIPRQECSGCGYRKSGFSGSQDQTELKQGLYCYFHLLRAERTDALAILVHSPRVAYLNGRTLSNLGERRCESDRTRFSAHRQGAPKPGNCTKQRKFLYLPTPCSGGQCTWHTDSRVVRNLTGKRRGGVKRFQQLFF